MDLRLADMDDLPQLKAMYGKIIDNMNAQNIQIWDEIYPCEFFADDIKDKHLYIMEEYGVIVAAFVLCDSNAGARYVKWEKTQAKALYLDRLGVNVDYLRKGIGSRTLREAVVLARDKGAQYVRLFVVDINEPAISLYRKNGFKQVDGIYEEKIDDELVLHEYGFEIETGMMKKPAFNKRKPAEKLVIP